MKSRGRWPLYLGVGLLTVFVLMALWPGLFTPYGAKEMFDKWLPLSRKHWLGTNSLGYDIFTELVYGTRQTLQVGLIGSVLSLLLGTAVGILSAVKGWIGALFNGLIHIFALLPRLITLVVLASFFGSSSGALILLICAFSWAGIARNVRAKVLHLSTQPFLESCRIQGYSRWHIAVYHVLPNLSDVLLSRFLLGVNSCIMLESTLSFLGFGDLYHPTWGTMIHFAYQRGAFLRRAYAYLLVPGLCIMLLSLSFYFISLFWERRREIIQEG